MVGRYDAGAAIQATRLALELKLLPVSFGIDGSVPSTLEDHFCTFLSDAVWREGGERERGGGRGRKREREMTDRQVEKDSIKLKLPCNSADLSFSPAKSSVCVDDSQ